MVTPLSESNFSVSYAGFDSSLKPLAEPTQIYYLLDLFPVPNGPLTLDLLTSTLKKYQVLIRLSKEALIKFQKRMMPFFDPLGGEHACHIRAAIFAELLNIEGIDDLIRLAIDNLEKQFSVINDLLKTPHDKKVRVDSFENFLRENNALLEMSETMILVIASFFLSETKTIEYKPNEMGIPNRHESIPYKNFGEKKGIGPNYANSLIKLAQEKVSKLSVIYVQKIALQLILNQEYKIASELVFGKNVRIDEKRRYITPCFPTMRLLLEGMSIRKIPLVIKIKQFVRGEQESYGQIMMIYTADEKGEFRLLSKYKQPFPKGVVFVHAKSITDVPQTTKALEENLSKRSINDLILSAAADHPQYGCDDTNPPQNPERDKFRVSAYKWGTCRSNPSLLLIDHICCDMIDINENGIVVETIYQSARQNAADLYQTIYEMGQFSWFRLRLMSNRNVIPVARLIDNEGFGSSRYGNNYYGKDKEFVFEAKKPLGLTYGSLIWGIEFRENPTQRVYPNRLYKLIIHD